MDLVVSVGAQRDVETVWPNRTLEIAVAIEVFDGLVLTPKRTVEAPDGGAAELEVATKILYGADETLDGGGAESIAVGLNNVAGVVGGR